jgi:hypothetical protein
MQLGQAPFIKVESLHLESALQQVMHKRLSHQSYADNTDAISHDLLPSTT